MPEASVPSPTVPYGADQTLFVVIDRLDRATEIRVERSDLEMDDTMLPRDTTPTQAETAGQRHFCGAVRLPESIARTVERAAASGPRFLNGGSRSAKQVAS